PRADGTAPGPEKAAGAVCPGKLPPARGCYFGGSTSPAPPQTSPRRWPVPLHSLQMPIVMPTRDFLPVPRHATQEVVLWPWHLGHNVFVGISPPLGIYLRCNSSRSLVILAAMRLVAGQQLG